MGHSPKLLVPAPRLVPTAAGPSGANVMDDIRTISSDEVVASSHAIDAVTERGDLAAARVACGEADQDHARWPRRRTSPDIRADGL